MYRIIFAVIALFIFAFAFACGGGQNASGGGSSPTDAYKKLYAAVKSKDTEAIKRQLSKKSINLAERQAAQNKKPIEQVYENGFTATTFSDTLPSIRDERIKDNMGAVEVWNSKESVWEDLPFILEDGSWKLAFGDVISRGYISPGPGRDFLEKQAANAVANSAIILSSNTNSNAVNGVNVMPGPPAPNKNAK